MDRTREMPEKDRDCGKSNESDPESCLHVKKPENQLIIPKMFKPNLVYFARLQHPSLLSKIHAPINPISLPYFLPNFQILELLIYTLQDFSFSPK